MQNFDSFKDAANYLGNLAKNFQKNANVVVKNIASNATRDVVLKTPVATGQARGNWRLNPTTPDEKAYIGPAYYDKAGFSTIAKATRGIYRSNASAFYLTNNLPYIQRLNEGYSKQAPALFIQSCVYAASKTYTKYLGLLWE